MVMGVLCVFPNALLCTALLSVIDSALIIGWSSNKFNQNAVQVYDPFSNTSLWTYHYPAEPRSGLQDIISSLFILQAKAVPLIVVGSWGDF